MPSRARTPGTSWAKPRLLPRMEAPVECSRRSPNTTAWVVTSLTDSRRVLLARMPTANSAMDAKGALLTMLTSWCPLMRMPTLLAAFVPLIVRPLRSMRVFGAPTMRPSAGQFTRSTCRTTLPVTTEPQPGPAALAGATAPALVAATDSTAAVAHHHRT